MIVITLTLLVFLQGLVCLATRSYFLGVVRGLENQNKMKDERIEELVNMCNSLEWAIEDEGLDLKCCIDCYNNRDGDSVL